MMNVKETLKRLHKKFPMMGLDELFDVLDCYIEEVDFSKTISTWEPSKVWYSTDKTTGVNETAKVTCVTNNTDPGIYTIATNKSADGKIAYYNGGGSTQLVANH